MHKQTLHSLIQLLRLDKPVGIWLLLWPGFFGIATASFGQAEIAWHIYALFALGAVVMRSAGCVLNDMLDRRYDAEVTRTKGRPLAAGALSLRMATGVFVLLCIAGLFILLQFNRLTLLLGIIAFALLCVYPLMKRFFPVPQLVLGAAFSMGVLMGYSAVAAVLHPMAWLLYAGCIGWVLAYDTIYAHQDASDDAVLGLRSSALSFGKHSRYVVMACYELFFISIAAVILWRSWPEIAWLPLSIVLLVYGMMEYRLWKLPLDDARACGRYFAINGWVGAAMFFALVA